MAVNPAMETGGNSVDDAAAAIAEMLSPMEEMAEEEEIEAVEGDEIESEADGEQEAESDEQPEDEPEEQGAIESLSDVAEALEVPLEDLLATLKHTVKVNGETLDVPLSELTAGYQKDKDYRQKTEALKREREQFETAAMERAKALEETHAHAAYVLNTIEQQIASTANSQELERLRQTNPQEWAAKRLELQDRLNAFQALKQQAAQSYAAFQQQTQTERAQMLQKTLEKEREALHAAIPDWSQETNSRLTSFLQDEYGFAPEQVAQVYDHRLVKMAYEAMKWRESQRSAQQTVKKVKAAPKLVKPSAKPSQTQIKRSEAAKLRGRLKQTGKVEDAARLILAGGILK